MLLTLSSASSTALLKAAKVIVISCTATIEKFWAPSAIKKVASNGCLTRARITRLRANCSAYRQVAMIVLIIAMYSLTTCAFVSAFSEWPKVVCIATTATISESLTPPGWGVVIITPYKSSARTSFSRQWASVGRVSYMEGEKKIKKFKLMKIPTRWAVFEWNASPVYLINELPTWTTAALFTSQCTYPIRITAGSWTSATSLKDLTFYWTRMTNCRP